MKKNLCFLLAFLYCLASKAQGVNFQHVTVAEAFKMAKSQNKPLFVEIFSPTCHVCQSFIPVFNEGTVGTFFNQNFVSIKVDVASPEFKDYFEKKQKVFALSIPLMLFYDGNENFLHHVQLGMGMGSDVVLGQAQIALDPNKRTANYKKVYQSGNRDKNLLINYALQCRLFRDTTTGIAVANDLYKEFPKNEIDNEISWLVCEKIVMDIDNGFFQHWINDVQGAGKFGKGYEKQTLEGIIFGSLFSSRGAKYSSTKINQINGYLSNLSYSKTEIMRRTLLPMAKALLKENLTTRATGEVENYLKSGTPAAPEYAYFVSLFNENAKDISYQSKAMEWLKKAVSLTKSPKDLAEIHYQSAKLYLKAGNKKEAEKAADLALRNAQSAKIDGKKFEQLVKDSN